MDAVIDLEIQIPLELRAYYQMKFEFLPILSKMGSYGLVQERLKTSLIYNFFSI